MAELDAERILGYGTDPDDVVVVGTLDWGCAAGGDDVHVDSSHSPGEGVREPFPDVGRSAVVVVGDSYCGRSRVLDWPLPDCSDWALDCGTQLQHNVHYSLHWVDSSSLVVHLHDRSVAAVGDGGLHHARETCLLVSVCP